MKSTLLTLAVASIVTCGFAQDFHSNNYDISAFRGYKDLPASKSPERTNTKTRVNQVFPGWYVFSDKLNGQFTDITGQAVTIPGTTLNDKASYVFSNMLNSLGVIGAQWTQVQSHDAGFATIVSYKQSLNGHPVVFSKLTLSFTKDGKLDRIQMKNYGTATQLSPSLSKEDALTAAKTGVPITMLDDSKIEDNWYWFPVPSKNGYELRPAWKFEINGRDEIMPIELKGYVDAITGEILYRTNGVKETVDVTVKGWVNKQNPLLPSTLESLADLEITLNGTSYYTDTAGFLSNTALSAPISATMTLQGRWSKVMNRQASNITPSFTTMLNNASNIVTFDTTAPSNSQQVNAYYHVTRVHDFMKGHFPTFTGMDFALPTNVDYSGTPTCNAFYTGSAGGSINFAVATAACNSFAYCGDIIYHEYGHGINDKYYQAQGQGGMNNGALNEGTADIWGLSITKDPVLGKGSMKNGAIIRRYDQTPKVYPVDIQGEVHADGEIIAGAWWDVGVNLSSVDTMAQIFTRSYIYTPDGANGTEGDVYHEVLVSALKVDDNDNNLVNGTPHFIQIVTAFARHGIYLLGDADIVHTDIANQPANTPITINASLNVSEPAFLQGMKLFYKDRTVSNWDSTLMTASGTNFTATIPGYTEGTLVDYYFAVYDNMSMLNKYFPINYTPTSPASTNNIIYQFGVGLDKMMGQDFEGTIDTAWKIGLSTDDATASGRWVVAVPVASYINGLITQTGADHTTGAGKCAVTGNASAPNLPPGTADVDEGITTILTPVFDLSNFVEPVIEYFRWYGNDRGSNRGNDLWEVGIKLESSTIWPPVGILESTSRSDYSWRRRIFSVKQLFPTVSPLKVQMRFVAADKKVTSATNNGQSTVEAAVDDIFIYDKMNAMNVNGVTAAKATIFPNPASEEIHVRLQTAAPGTISLTDISGKELMNATITSQASEYVFPTKALANGVYMITIRTNSSVQTAKVNVIH
jgi:Zn-dependent metalloprotease